MKSLLDVQKKWEAFAHSDPLWAICSDPDRKHRRWDRDEFFATGEHEIKQVMQCLAELHLSVPGNGRALDFGCGVGRLTRAMAGYFAECCGVDISPSMIEMAQRLNSDKPNCSFVVNDQPELKQFAEGQFAFIYTSIVLQHIPVRYTKKYLMEFVRVLQPGGLLVFQVQDEFRAPALTRLRHKIAIRSRIKGLLSASGEEDWMDVYFIPEAEVRGVLQAAGVKVLDVRFTNSSDPSFNGQLRYEAKAPERGYISKQYVAIKP